MTKLLIKLRLLLRIPDDNASDTRMEVSLSPVCNKTYIMRFYCATNDSRGRGRMGARHCRKKQRNRYARRANDRYQRWCVWTSQSTHMYTCTSMFTHAVAMNIRFHPVGWVPGYISHYTIREEGSWVKHCVTHRIGKTKRAWGRASLRVA